jgi:hypothetical protein
MRTRLIALIAVCNEQSVFRRFHYRICFEKLPKTKPLSLDT